MDELSSWLALNMIDGIGGAKFKRLLDRFGSPFHVLKASLSQLAEVDGIGDKIGHAIISYDRDRVQKELELIDRYGISVLTWDDGEYPEKLSQIFYPPPLLYTKGDIKLLSERCMAVVGSRNATGYGLGIAREFSRELAKGGWVIVSGLARGIDSAAHRGALEGGRTVAVLGCGLNVVYPPENRELMGQIAERGLLVSEFPLSTGPLRNNFPRRNRIISGLSLGVVVVEAGDDSGALITAEYAMEQGREVFAVPGSIKSPQAKGAHQLIKDGAKLVGSIDDILEDLEPAHAPGKREASPDVEKSPPPLSADENLVYGLLSYSEAMHVDKIASLANLPVSRALATLTVLEMKSLVRQSAGKMFLRE
jgi:DNA processing protein